MLAYKVGAAKTGAAAAMMTKKATLERMLKKIDSR
jgi:hypothetical protein